eukprot:3362399-Amphidinium_carterae.1
MRSLLSVLSPEARMAHGWHIPPRAGNGQQSIAAPCPHQNCKAEKAGGEVVGQGRGSKRPIGRRRRANWGLWHPFDRAYRV